MDGLFIPVCVFTINSGRLGVISTELGTCIGLRSFRKRTLWVDIPSTARKGGKRGVCTPSTARKGGKRCVCTPSSARKGGKRGVYK